MTSELALLSAIGDKVCVCGGTHFSFSVSPHSSASSSGPSGTGHSCPYQQGQLYHAAAANEGQDQLHAFMTTGPDILPAPGGEGK